MRIGNGDSQCTPAAPNFKHRKRIVPRRPRPIDADQPPAPMTWAQRLRRVFAIDIETCPKCGGKLRVIAFLLAGFCLLSAFLFHANTGDQVQTILFMKNLAMAGGYLMIVSLGAGAFSLDNRKKN